MVPMLTVRQGAGHVGKYLEEEYGTDSFAALLDEGGKNNFLSSDSHTDDIAAPFGEIHGGNVVFAMPYTAEKGYFDLKVEVSTLGGHSSVPPRHTVTSYPTTTHPLHS